MVLKGSQNGLLKQAKPNGVKAKPDAAQGLHDLFVNERKDNWLKPSMHK